MNGQNPLAGLRVIEWTTFVAAPVCGRMLADWGADVIKVEMPEGDYWRIYGPKLEVPASDDENPLFDIANANKRSITLDLRTKQGREIMEKLLSQADVLITNTRERVLKKLALDYDAVKQRYPGLIYAQVSGYGECGEQSHRPGYDVCSYWAYSGFLADMKLDEPGNMPINIPAAIGDIGAGSMLFGAIMAALYAKRNSGKGDKVSVSLYGEAIWNMAVMNTIAQPGYDYKYPRRRDEVKPISAAYQCADGEWIAVAAVQYNRDFPRICEALGIPEIAKKPGYADYSSMMEDENRVPLIHLFEKCFLQKTAAQWDEIFTQEDVVHDLLAHFKDISGNEQARANHFVEEVTFRNGKKSWLPRPCIKSDNLGVPEYRLAPIMGENSVQILRELGYSEAEISQMKDGKAFFCEDKKAEIR